jgi:hypothetical protein
MVECYKDKVEIAKKAYKKCSKNYQMLSHYIQKDFTKAFAEEVMIIIMDEIRGRKFSVLIDESQDVSIKEQMVVNLRLVFDSKDSRNELGSYGMNLIVLVFYQNLSYSLCPNI